MTITVGSVWAHKRSVFVKAAVVKIFRYGGRRYIIYEAKGRFDDPDHPILKLRTEREFLHSFKHPDTVGDVP